MAVADVSDRTIEQLISLEGRCAVVTGGATGLGKAMARRLAEAGANVLIADIDAPLASAAAEEIRAMGRGQVVACRCDAANEAECEQVAAVAAEHFGGIDIWVGNAALYPSIPLLDMTVGEWDEVMAVNLRGVFIGARTAARRMIERGQGGVIINVASQAGFRGVAPGLCAYVASKHGVRGMTRQLALELAPFDIRVLGVAPSHARTEKTARAIAAKPELLEQIPALSTSRLGRVGVPDDIGRVVLFLASDMAAFMSGTTVKVDAAEMA
ncbi:NAD(P)-dependent dehydrogenase (short-subunit alcohol dehydrogenase family) [Novosphingobium sp. PhB165]|uniref:SDR family NAD(P)-dependent oxidoreductase n=1 Tax=Novosphingobium sp. PhB165 TaxID=2485105 RepID=UPI00104B2AFE|nr:SDR family NAD(P)-dependent oxidoreductase [Novosphingobium sp. PhB165]TCM20707.1 NAD(P)-dependent dehydrogenase (short-subunit alcohol dehydrogenase family) [Novosphingobium sp. PhB165]